MVAICNPKNPEYSGKCHVCTLLDQLHTFDFFPQSFSHIFFTSLKCIYLLHLYNLITSYPKLEISIFTVKKKLLVLYAYISSAQES